MRGVATATERREGEPLSSIVPKQNRSYPQLTEYREERTSVMQNLQNSRIDNDVAYRSTDRSRGGSCRTHETTMKNLSYSIASLLLLALVLTPISASAQVSSPAPTTASGFTIQNPAGEQVTLRIPNSGVTPYSLFFPSTAPTSGGLFMGTGTSGNTTWLQPGNDGQILQIVSGLPSWENVNLLPTGSTTNSTLIWDGTNWVENTNVTLTPGGDITNAGNTNTTGNTTIGGDLTVGGDVILGNGVINNNELENSSFNVTYGTGLSGDASVALGGTLNLSNTGVVSLTGTTNQVIVTPGAGTGEFVLSTPQDIHTDATPTFDGLILDNVTGSSSSSSVLVLNGSNQVETRTIFTLPGGTTTNSTLIWDGTNWVENTNVTLTPGGDVNAVGATFTGSDVNMTGLPTTGTVTDQNVLIVDPSGNVTETSPSGVVGAASLPQNNIYVGNGNGNPQAYAPGTPGQVLQINGSNAPTWQSINLLPAGAGDHATLAWDAASGTWKSNPFVTIDDVTHNITTAGAVTAVNATFTGADINLPNVPTTAAPLASTDRVLITNNAGDVFETGPTQIVGAATLLENYIYVGNGNDNPQGVAPGSSGQVLQISGGTPTWQTINVLPTGTTNHATLVWDAGTNTWVQNANVTMDDASGNIATTGSVSGGDATFTGSSIRMTNTPVTGTITDQNVLIVDPSGNVTETDPTQVVGAATLPQNNIYVGNGNNNPQAYAPGTPGQVLQINGSNTPTWQTINILPNGIVDHAVLVWDAGSGTWVSNTQTTIDNANGDITTNGDVTAVDATLAGTLTVQNGGDVVLPNGVINNNELENSSFNVTYGTGLSGDASVALGGTLNLNNTGVTSLTGGTGISVDASTGAVTITNDGITQINGTTNQVIANTVSGVTTLSTPQDIHTDATPTFDGLTLDNLSNDNTVATVIVSDGGVLKTRAVSSLTSGSGGRVSTASATNGGGGWSMTITDPAVTATSPIVVSYEDPAGGAQKSVHIGNRTGTTFTVHFSGAPVAGSFVNYSVL